MHNAASWDRLDLEEMIMNNVISGLKMKRRITNEGDG